VLKHTAHCRRSSIITCAAARTAEHDPDDYVWDEREFVEVNNAQTQGYFLRKWWQACIRLLDVVGGALAGIWGSLTYASACASTAWGWLTVFTTEVAALAAAALHAPLAAIQAIQRIAHATAWLVRKNIMRMMPNATRRAVKETIDEVSTLQARCTVALATARSFVLVVPVACAQLAYMSSAQQILLHADICSSVHALFCP
jgi:hypothetical protein